MAASLSVSAQQFLPVKSIVNARVEAYLKGPMGLTDEDIQTLRGRYLE